MSKVTISNYIFNPTARTITFPGYPNMATQGNLLLISNATRNIDMYLFNNPSYGAVISGGVATLTYDTSAMSANDDLIIYYDDGRASLGISTTQKRFRDNFSTSASQPDASVWRFTNNDGHIVSQGGNSSGSSYLRISVNPLIEDTFVSLVSREVFSSPIRVGYSISLSQRIIGQEAFIGIASDKGDGTGALDTSLTPTIADITLPSTVTVAVANTLPITLPSHGLKGGDRVILFGNLDSRLNIGPVAVVVTDPNTISLPITLAIGTYNAGGTLRAADPLRSLSNSTGYLFDTATATTGSVVTRRDGIKFRTTPVASIATTIATQSNTSPYTDAFNASSIYEMEYEAEEISYRSLAADGGATNTSFNKYTSAVPDESFNYHLMARYRTHAGVTRPVARITGIAKTGTTTATVTTDVAHGLTTNDWVQIYGVTDQTNFPNLAAQTQVVGTPTTTTFTVVIGTASTTSSTGGAVFRVQGSSLVASAFASAIQSISATGNILSVVGNVAWATPLPGEMVWLYGLTSSLASYEGAYQVGRVNTTTLELLPVNGATITTLSSTNTGGVAMRMTDFRIHTARVLDHTRIITEVIGGRGNVSDANNAVPVTIAASATLPANVTQSTGSAAVQWNAAGYAGLLATDAVAAALTATTTTAAITPGLTASIGANSNSYTISVTASSGTSQTLDVGVEESPDGGTTYQRIYDFPRITGVLASPLVSPQIPKKAGSLIRYVQTVGGTSPSFTRSVIRNMYSTQAPYWRQFIDHTSVNTGGTVVLTTLNSTTPTYNVEGAKDFQLVLSLAAATTPPAIQLQGSEDNGTTWYNLGAPLTGVASSAVTLNVLNSPTRQVRALVSTAGAALTTANSVYVMIKAMGL